jgi:mxaK protein
MATSVKMKTRVLVSLLVFGIIGAMTTGKKLAEIKQFNQAVSSGQPTETSNYPFEARYAAAYTLAVNGRYQDATQLFNQLMESPATPAQIAAVQYNLGNIFMIRGLMVNHNGEEVKDEAEYLLNQARLAFEQSLRLDNRHLDARHNLDRVLSLLPGESSAEGEQEKLGIIMGNIPTGLP